MTLSNGGAGVVVGIVDYGADFAHQNFRTAAGGTRLLSIWDQNSPNSANGPFGYGRKISQAEINRALQANNPYTALGYGPEPDRPRRPMGSHGTHVMDIAAGNGYGSQVAGVAPQADLIFVDVSHGDIDFAGRAVLDNAFGDSVRLLEAIQFIFNEAGNRPCVINVSLGTNGGPHDGSTLVEMGIDALIAQQPNRMVVIAAGNAFDDGIHISGTLAQAGTVDLRWVVPIDDKSLNEFELWYSGADRFDVEVLAPDGTSLLTVPPGGADARVEANGNMPLVVVSRLDDPNNHDNQIGIYMEAGVEPGVWTVRLHGTTIQHGAFHAWIERDNEVPSQFTPVTDSSYTLSSISCGRLATIVGSYDAHKPTRPLSFFSAAGPTRDQRQKPDISAPGHAVLAAHSRTKTGVVNKSGTSMAAPAVTGVIALMLAEAAQRGITLSGEQILQLVIAAAQRTPPAGNEWHDQYGHGRLSATHAVQAVIDLAGVPVVAEDAVAVLVALPAL
jgi:subtilisin family serine protease